MSDAKIIPPSLINKLRDPFFPFWSRIEAVDGGCWIWGDSVNDKGYGIFFFGRKRIRVHRITYHMLIGGIPLGLVSRGVGITAQNTRKTICVNGHQFSPENTKNVAGKRRCRLCAMIRKRKSRCKI